MPCSGMRRASAHGHADCSCSSVGLWMLMRILADELRADGITVDGLIPGPVEIMMTVMCQRPGSTVNNPVEWLRTPENMVSLAMLLATLPTPGPTGQSFSRMRRAPARHYPAATHRAAPPAGEGSRHRTVHARCARHGGDRGRLRLPHPGARGPGAGRGCGGSRARRGRRHARTAGHRVHGRAVHRAAASRGRGGGTGDRAANARHAGARAVAGDRGWP